MQSCSQCTATITGVDLSGMMNLLCHVHSSKHTITIDVDINWFVMNKCKYCDSVKASADKIISIMKSLANCGCVCCPICDPEVRHHTKRASMQRKTSKFFNYAKSVSARYKLIHVTQILSNANNNESETSHLITEKNKLSKLAEKASTINANVSDVVRMLSETVTENYCHLRRGCIKLICS